MATVKGFNIVPDGRRPSWVIKYEGGGEVPDVLKGGWTSVHEAEQAIKSFQATVRARVQNATKSRRTKTQ